MLRFEERKDSDGRFDINRDLEHGGFEYVGTIYCDGEVWFEESVFTAAELRQIADRLDELNGKGKS